MPLILGRNPINNSVSEYAAAIRIRNSYLRDAGHRELLLSGLRLAMGEAE